MKRALRHALTVAAGGAAMLVLDRIASRRGGGPSRITRALLYVMRPTPVADETLETRVRNRLARTATNPEAITVSIEHGCVDLRGPVSTRERPRIVRAIATVPGVDSVVDLMTEPPLATAPTSTSTALARRAPAWAIRRPEWTTRARIVAAGSGLGLTIAGLRIGGLFALPAAAGGLLLLAGSAAATSRPRGEPREPHAAF